MPRGLVLIVLTSAGLEGPPAASISLTGTAAADLLQTVAF